MLVSKNLAGDWMIVNLKEENLGKRRREREIIE